MAIGGVVDEGCTGESLLFGVGFSVSGWVPVWVGIWRRRWGWKLWGWVLRLRKGRGRGGGRIRVGVGMGGMFEMLSLGTRMELAAVVRSR